MSTEFSCPWSRQLSDCKKEPEHIQQPRTTRTTTTTALCTSFRLSQPSLSLQAVCGGQRNPRKQKETTGIIRKYEFAGFFLQGRRLSPPGASWHSWSLEQLSEFRRGARCRLELTVQLVDHSLILSLGFVPLQLEGWRENLGTWLPLIRLQVHRLDNLEAGELLGLGQDLQICQDGLLKCVVLAKLRQRLRHVLLLGPSSSLVRIDDNNGDELCLQTIAVNKVLPDELALRV
mmetsp:Transcript_43953/g.79495  ORF Transcript_43953/g.79495 Transcript_43953/m.79495 type:complete len:232 (+) Transcript_43953:87-782(+)